MEKLTTVMSVIFCLLLITFDSLAQNVGINEAGTAPHASALLDLSATDKGFLITRADTTNIVSPAFGLMTLAPADSCIYLYDGNKWMGMGGAGSECKCNCGSSSPSTSNCGSPFTDARDNIAYKTVQIGNQCWMSENLNYTPNSGNSWCYNNSIANCNNYGRLYDWNTAMDNASSSNSNPSGIQGICPDGWHFPSDDEWKELEMELGMIQNIADGTNWRGTNEGDALKALNFGGNNSSGFTALSGGHRNPNSLFNFEGSLGYWWTTTESATHAWSRRLADSRSDVYRDAAFIKDFGLSVRCVRN